MNCPHCQAPNSDEARFCGSCGRATSSTEPTANPNAGEAPTLIGREIAGRYRIQAKLGEGGMGAVYKAEQISLKRTVAVKLLRPEVASSQLLLRRFNAEAEAVAKLSHPNTVNIYDFGQDSDGTLFIAMELIEGQSLRQVIHREAPFALRRALAIGLQVASSLTDAHARAIIHRDLKPDNVMLQQRGRERDIVRVLDFGIAKLRDEDRKSQMAMTQAGDMLGTPQYMAPEQIRAEQIDGRTDVYALGCLLYEMITARLPYEAQTIMSLLSKHLTEATIPPSQRRPDLGLPPAIDQLVLAAMAKDPRDRPPTMEMFGELIAALMATLPPDTGAGAVVPGMGPSIVTPPAYSAAAPASFAPPSTPPPGGFAPPSSAPPGFTAPTQPGAGMPVTSAPTLVPRGGSSNNKTLWIVLGALVLAGAGVGIFMATRTPAVTEPDPWAGGSSAGSPDDHGPSDPVVDDGDDDEPKTVARPAAGFTSVMQGVSIKLPPGFTIQKQESDGFLAIDARGIAIIAAPIPSGSDDFAKLVGDYARETGLAIEETGSDTVAGEDRGMAHLKGTFMEVASDHLVTALIAPSYRVVVILHIPSVLMTDSSIATLMIDLFTNGVAVPATVSP